MSRPNIRPMQPVDAPGVASIFGDATVDGAGRGWSAAAIGDRLAGGGFGFVAAESEDKLSGAILASAAPPDYEIVNIAVSPSMRRRGVGRDLAEAAIKAARTRRGERLLLEVSIENAAALALYRKLGFSAVGKRPQYYRNGNRLIDAQIMALNLTAAFKAS